jgi:hypothetical protein
VKTPHKSRRRRLAYETLEPREVMAASITAALNAGGVLNVWGTDGDDYMSVRQHGSQISIQGIDAAWSASKVKSIVVSLYAGNDTVSIDSFANGGNKLLKEKVTVWSGAGLEHVRLAGGQSLNLNGPGQRLEVSPGAAPQLNGAALNLSNQVVASLKSGVLNVSATNGNDNIAFKQIGGKIWINGVIGSWWASKVKSIVVNLQAGNDIVSLDSLANGGTQLMAENITVKSGSGNSLVHLANGHDVSLNGPGHTLVVWANGSATLDGQPLSWDNPAPDPDPTPDPPTNWFNANIQDAALRSLGSSLYVDSVINRGDMLALFQNVQDGGAVDGTEFADLQRIVSNTTLFGTFDHVWKLTSYIVSGNTANAKYQGQTLGNLAAGSTATQLGNLVNKWFLGLDRPTASGTYRAFVGQLFVNGVAYTDAEQGAVGNCYLIASLAEAAYRDASKITSMFIVNGDGTYTVKFHQGSTAHYVTVDSYLPTYSSGAAIYAANGLMYNNTAGELWVALAEKAYVQLHEMGWVRPGLSGNGQNSYAAIAGGYIGSALSHITGRSNTFTMTSSSTSFTTFVTAYNGGKMIGFASYANPPAGSPVVGSHAYAVVGYNAANQTVTLFNPWGIQYGLITMSWSQIQANFQYFDRTV